MSTEIIVTTQGYSNPSEMSAVGYIWTSMSYLPFTAPSSLQDLYTCCKELTLISERSWQADFMFTSFAQMSENGGWTSAS